MIDTEKYKIEDDVVWVWKDDPEKQGWVLWEYKECPEDMGGYPVGSDPDKTYEPWIQVLTALVHECEINEKMQAITDLPLLLAEVKRLRNKLFEAEIHIDPFTDDYTFENDLREIHMTEAQINAKGAEE